jgi:hypothetical protein
VTACSSINHSILSDLDEFRYLEDGVETNEEELHVGDDKASSSINNSTLSALYVV